jgi:hypothetical protein
MNRQPIRERTQFRTVGKCRECFKNPDQWLGRLQSPGINLHCGESSVVHRVTPLGGFKQRQQHRELFSCFNGVGSSRRHIEEVTGLQMMNLAGQLKLASA